MPSRESVRVVENRPRAVQIAGGLGVVGQIRGGWSHGFVAHLCLAQSFRSNTVSRGAELFALRLQIVSWMRQLWPRI